MAEKKILEKDNQLDIATINKRAFVSCISPKICYDQWFEYRYASQPTGQPII
jgi:hypothetical protein